MCSQFAEQASVAFFIHSSVYICAIILYCVIIWFFSLILLKSNVAKFPKLISFVCQFLTISAEREKERNTPNKIESIAHAETHSPQINTTSISVRRHGRQKSLRIFHKNHSAGNEWRWLRTAWNKHIRCTSVEYKLSCRRQCKHCACVAAPMSGATFAKVKKVMYCSIRFYTHVYRFRLSRHGPRA